MTRSGNARRNVRGSDRYDDGQIPLVRGFSSDIGSDAISVRSDYRQRRGRNLGLRDVASVVSFEPNFGCNRCSIARIGGMDRRGRRTEIVRIDLGVLCCSRVRPVVCPTTAPKSATTAFSPARKDVIARPRRGRYNYFRDYDPSTGRYQQSDPIGLRGGLNTFAYVASSPLRWSDIYGLDGNGFSTRYGNWCGKNWSGGKGGPKIPVNPGAPVDSVDQCCMVHDYCYASVEDCATCPQQDNSPQKLNCDRALLTCLSALKGKPPQAWPKPPPLDRESESYFFCQKAKRYFEYKLGL